MVITRMMKPTKDLRTINIVYKCPGGMLVTNKLYNVGATDQFMLVAKIEGCGSKYKKMTQSHFIVYFDMVVVGSEEKIRQKRDATDEDLNAMFAGMHYNEDDDDEFEEFEEEFEGH